MLNILPFSRTLDPAHANLTVARREVAALKGERSPHEAFHGDAHAAEGVRWETVAAAAQDMPPYKAWRFGPEAMDAYDDAEAVAGRHLSDRAHLAGAAARYLGCLDGAEVEVSRGTLKGFLRASWRLNGILADDNQPGRRDHRHHAVGAAVVALADREALKAMAEEAAGGQGPTGATALAPGLAEAVRLRAPEIVTSFKPDHGWHGAMFKGTAYGFVRRPSARLPGHNLVTRKPLADLTAGECEAIRSDHLRDQVREALAAMAFGTDVASKSWALQAEALALWLEQAEAGERAEDR